MKKNKATAQPYVQAFGLKVEGTVHLKFVPCGKWTHETVLQALNDGDAEWDSGSEEIFIDDALIDEDMVDDNEDGRHVIARVTRMEIVTHAG